MGWAMIVRGQMDSAAHRRRARYLLFSALAVTGLGAGGVVPAEAAPLALVQSPAPAVRTPHLPEGWTFTPGITTDRLVWRQAGRGPGDARVQFFAGNRLLGTPRMGADGRSYRLDLAPGSLPDPAALQVRAGGRRIDAAGAAVGTGSGSLVRPQPVPKTTTLPPITVDPGRPGAYSTVSGEYSLPGVKLPDFPEPVEMQAVVVAPKRATGRHPLALFLHGRHPICYGTDDADAAAWPCPVATKPIPSYRGYLKAQQLLASQGYVTVSISANGINGQDFASNDGGAQARSSLIRLHLAQWANWSGRGRAQAPAIVRKAPRADLSQVLLMGHSRGGEGVNRAAIDSLTTPPRAADGYHGPVRWKIRGTLQLAPTLFGQNPAADVPSVVVLPGCDGDVYDLQGQITVDGTRGVGSETALHSAAFVVGANHNYFNSEWTPGLSAAPSWDDWFDEDDAICGTASATSVRLTPAQEQQVGATYIAAAARLFIKGDDRVLPLLDGSGVRAPSVAPAQVLTHAVGAARRPLVVPAADVTVTASAGSKARLCLEVSQTDRSCLPQDSFATVPSFTPFYPLLEEPDRYAIDLSWSSANGRGATLSPRRPVSLAKDRSVAIRMILPANTPATRFDVLVADTAGHRARLGSATLTGLPGTEQTVGSWAQELRVPLAAARRAGLNLGRIAELRVIPRSAGGQAYLLDAWGWQPGTPGVRIATRTRIDVGDHEPVTEPDSVVTYRLPVSFSGPGTGQVRLSTVDYNTGEVGSSQLFTIRPGIRHIDVPIQVRGDSLFSYGNRYVVLAKAVHDTVAGGYQGVLDVSDDDPAPTVTVTPLADRVTEGGSLSWRITMSAPAASFVYVPLTILPPTSGTELSTTDVPEDWVFEQLFVDPLPSRPLSEATAQSFLAVYFPEGSTEAEVTVPTVADDLVEGEEILRVDVGSIDGSPLPQPLEVTGTVID